QPSTVDACTPSRRAIWSTVALPAISSSTAACRSSTLRRPGRARTFASPVAGTSAATGTSAALAGACSCCLRGRFTVFAFSPDPRGDFQLLKCQPLDGEHRNDFSVKVFVYESTWLLPPKAPLSDDCRNGFVCSRWMHHGVWVQRRWKRLLWLQGFNRDLLASGRLYRRHSVPERSRSLAKRLFASRSRIR